MYKIFGLILAIFLSGCAVSKVDRNYENLLLDDNVSINLDEKWWLGYGENYLNELVDLGLKNNTDLAKSAINLQKARAKAGLSEADLLPDFSFKTGANTNRDTSMHSEWKKGYTSGFTLNYELDLWAKLADAKDAALWEVNASEFDLQAVRLSVINSIIDGYFNALYLNEAYGLYTQTLEIYEELGKIVSSKVANGKDEEISLRQVQSQILNTKNRLTSTQNSIQTNEQMLRNALNERPNFEFKFKNILDTKTLGVDLDVPLYSLSKRPDLNAAIARIKQSLLNLQVSEKSFYPSISIGASLQGNDENWDESFRLSTLGGTLSINLPFLNYSRLKANLNISEASFEAAKLEYISTLTTALNEVDMAYKALQNDTNLYQNYLGQIENYEKIAQIYKLKNEVGKVELKEYLQAKNNEIDARINLISQRYKMLKDEIKIYQAMAGKAIK
ncbi:MAG: TolC family protein [Campylobacter sp.]|nr:TolC family protein [Campylobacter sp.]